MGLYQPTNQGDSHPAWNDHEQTVGLHIMAVSLNETKLFSSFGQNHLAEKRRYPEDLDLTDDDSISQPDLDKVEHFQSAASEYNTDVDVISGEDDDIILPSSPQLDVEPITPKPKEHMVIIQPAKKPKKETREIPKK